MTTKKKNRDEMIECFHGSVLFGVLFLSWLAGAVWSGTIGKPGIAFLLLNIPLWIVGSVPGLVSMYFVGIATYYAVRVFIDGLNAEQNDTSNNGESPSSGRQR